MSIAFRFCTVSFATALVAAHALAQASNWDTLRDLKPGARVSVACHDGQVIHGTLSGWSADGLQIATSSDSRTLTRQSIYRVQVRERSSRWRGALIGGLVGFGGGFLIGASSAGYITDRNNPSASWRAAVGSGLGLYGAGIGAPIGALTAGSKTRTIYRAEAKR